MKHIKPLLFLAAVLLGFTACKKGFDAEAQFSADTTAIRNYVNANKIPVIKDEFGVFRQVITPGSGSTKFSESTWVTVDYSGNVMGESENFDSSKGEPREFQLGGLIAGWQIGIPKIQKGGEIRLFIPSKYGYGNNSQPGIPANSILEFNIKLTDVR